MARAVDLPTVRRYPRQYFLDRVWAHRPDEHVTILGPTGSGKTTLAQQLLERAATPENPAVILVMKPRDRTTAEWMGRVAYRKVTTWPQPPSIWRPRKPPGYVLWPRHVFNTDLDNAAHYRIFERALMDCYKRGHRIVFADETTGLQRLGLTEELETIWERGRSQPCSLWACSQRPAYISSHAYNQSSHVFLAYIKDKRSRDRFGEISGVDEQLVRTTVANLRRYEWLYIRQEDQAMCIVER